jgi:hypothetical protein
VGEVIDALGSERAADEVLAALLFTLALGLAFFAGRGPLIDLLQRLPGRLLARLRRTLVRRQAARRLKVDREAEIRAHLVTILDAWLSEKSPGFERPRHLPAFEVVPAEREMRTASAAARATILSLLPYGVPPTSPPSEAESTLIRDGLRALYAYVHHHHGDPASTEEIEKWRTLVSSRAARRVLDIVSDGVHREWAEARVELDGFPEPQWLRPTALGTRASALDGYAEKRYGIPTSTLVQRLLGALPEADRKQIGDARLQVETLANLAASAVLLAAAVTVGSIAIGVRHVRAEGDLVLDPRTATFILVPALLGWLFYRAAVLASGELSDRLVRAVDLHRLKLIEKLGFARPRDVREERELWGELAAFFAGDGDLDQDRPILSEDKE